MKPGLLRLSTFVASLVLGGLFVYASWHKLVDPAAFAKMVHQFKLLPGEGINLTAIYLPPLELLCGVALILFPRWRVPAALLLLAMLIVFTTAISVNLARGISITCGCFSSDPSAAKAGWGKVAENLGMIALALWIVFMNARGACIGKNHE